MEMKDIKEEEEEEEKKKKKNPQSLIGWEHSFWDKKNARATIK